MQSKFKMFSVSKRVGNQILKCKTHLRIAKPISSCNRMRASEFDDSYNQNNNVAPQIRNRNPMNLEKMTIGYKPSGYPMEKRKRTYWNALDLAITGQHTTATVTHWTGRIVCSASTKEWAIRKFLYNYTDAAALKCVGKIIGQRCLETGVTEVSLQLRPEDFKKERMQTFVESIKNTGLLLEEPAQYEPYDPYYTKDRKGKGVPVKPWTIIDE